MAKYSNWVKKAEAPDIGNFYAFTGNKKKKSIINFFFCFGMLVLQVVSGLINPPSSHSFLVYLPYVTVFLPFPFLLGASCRLFRQPVVLSRKQWEKSLGSLKHSDIGLIIVSGICLVCELVYIILHYQDLVTASSLPVEFAFCCLQAVLLAAAILYGVFYDKNFSGL